MPLLEGTLITLKDGITKKVEDLKIEDLNIIHSVKDINGLKDIKNTDNLQRKELLTFNGSLQESKIKNIWLDLSSELCKINNLSVDKSHYLFIQRNGKYYWSEARYCLENDELFKIDNTWEKIDTIEEIEGKMNVYNIRMNNYYNYFANDYLVHNGGTPCNGTNKGLPLCGSNCGASAGSEEEEEEGEGGGI